MTNNKTGGPAFPAIHDKLYEPGMTLLDYFAAKAMQGLLSNSEIQIDLLKRCGIGFECPNDGLSKLSYKYADAMLKEKERIENER
jgi:hypothetical protein